MCKCVGGSGMPARYRNVSLWEGQVCLPGVEIYVWEGQICLLGV